MIHLKDRRFWKPELSDFSALVLHHAVVLLLLTHSSGGQFQIISSAKPVLALVGDDIILPCHLDPPTDVVAKTLEWSRFDLNPRFVHRRRDGVELLINQHLLYKGRTSVSTDKLKHGDVSLKLSNVKTSDEGKYKCLIPDVGTSTVELVVGAVSSPVVIIAEIDKTTGTVVLQCESKGWYPEPEVLWLDSEGNLLSAGPTETVRGPDDLYTVSSRVTVEKRHSNNITCRVQQRNINQTRTTEIHILEKVFMASSYSAVHIIVVSSVSFMISVAVCFVLLKLNNATLLLKCRKMHHNNETDGGKRDKEQLVNRSMEMKDLDEKTAKLKKKIEEKMVLVHVHSGLVEQKIELEISRDELLSHLEEVEREKTEYEEKLNSAGNKDKCKENSNLSEAMRQLEISKENYLKSVQSVEEQIQKTEKIITRMTKLKEKVQNEVEQMIKLVDETETERRESEETSVRGEKLKL